MTMSGYWRTINPIASRAIVGGYGQVNNVHYLFPQGDGILVGNTGGINVYSTFADLKPNLRSRDLIILAGVLKEQAVAPDDIYDVTIVGAANKPRQATSSGVPTGGGAYWTAPASPVASTPLLEITRQGWRLENICFSPVASSPAVRLTSNPLVDAVSSGHIVIDNCYFVGGGSGQIGIEDKQGAGFVTVQNSRFLLLASAITYASIGGNLPAWWEIRDNWFSQNTNDIKISLGHSIITRNQFMTAGSGGTNKVIHTNASTGGEFNHVVLNQFSNAAANIQNSNGYNGAANDVWNNYVTDNSGALVAGVPGA